jgi:hypothetical protein
MCPNTAAVWHAPAATESTTPMMDITAGWSSILNLLASCQQTCMTYTIAVCKVEHVIAGYIRQVWEDKDWLYEGQHGFRPGYSCEIQIITVCQDISDSLDEAARLDVIIINFSKAFDLVCVTGCLKNFQPRAWIQGWSYGLGNF